MSVENTHNNTLCGAMIFSSICVLARIVQKKISEKSIIENDLVIDWYENLKKSTEKCSKLNIKEWNNDGGIYRKREGWIGQDYMHSSTSPVRILDYILLQPHDDIHDYSIVAPIIFTKNAESHKGLCHGGTMCAAMDDVIGWCGFCESGSCRPWSGYTVQVDTSLKKAISIGSTLMIEAWIEKRVGERKIYIKAKLSDPSTGIEHGSASGLFLKNIKH
jgi:hypothetical protein